MRINLNMPLWLKNLITAIIFTICGFLSFFASIVMFYVTAFIQWGLCDGADISEISFYVAYYIFLTLFIGSFVLVIAGIIIIIYRTIMFKKMRKETL